MPSFALKNNRLRQTVALLTATSSALAIRNEFSILPAMPGRTQTRASENKRVFGYEPALDGVRAVAVLLVLAGHLHLVYAGGLGVDIFFVLSGYLITAILVAEFSAGGRIDLKKFYARRALRILPAVVLLLVALNVLAAITQPREQVQILRWDSLGALFYVANWLRAFGRDLGIVGHLWSLDRKS